MSSPSPNAPEDRAARQGVWRLVLRRLTPGRATLQVFGLALGLALFAWAGSLAMSPENKPSIDALRAAPTSEVLALFGLTAAGLVLNGLMFWVVIRPVHGLRAFDVVLVNGIATFLSILPFKLSLVARVLVHHRRDGVRLSTLIAWVAAMGALGLAVLLPFVGATLWRGRLDAWWWAASLLGVVFSSVMAVVLGRLSDRSVWLRRASLGSHAIVRHASAVVGHAVLRLMDVSVLAGRFAAAAAIVNQPMPLEQAILLATTYFLLSVLTPAGTLGFREMGVAALGLSQGMDEHSVALVALVVTVAEVLSSGALALWGAIHVRLDRLFLSSRAAASDQAAPRDV